MAASSQSNPDRTPWPVSLSSRRIGITRHPSVQQYVLALQQQLGALKQHVDQLQQQVELLQGRLDKTSQTSSTAARIGFAFPQSPHAPHGVSYRANAGARRAIRALVPSCLRPPRCNISLLFHVPVGHGDMGSPRFYHTPQMIECTRSQGIESGTVFSTARRDQWTSAEQTSDGIDQDRKGRLPAAGMFGAATNSAPPSGSLTLSVPPEPLRHSPPNRRACSARLLVASTPCSHRNTHSEAISRCKRLTKRPASSWRSW